MHVISAVVHLHFVVDCTGDNLWKNVTYNRLLTPYGFTIALFKALDRSDIHNNVTFGGIFLKHSENLHYLCTI